MILSMTGSKVFDNIAAAFLLSVTLATSGIYIYTQFIYEKPYLDNEKEFKLLQKKEKEKFNNNTYRLDKLIINLPSETSRNRFFEVRIYLIPFEGNDIRDFEDYKAVIQDSIIDIAGRMSAGELSSVSGKLLLKSRVKKRINTLMNKNAVRKIYFTRFIVQ